MKYRTFFSGARRRKISRHFLAASFAIFLAIVGIHRSTAQEAAAISPRYQQHEAAKASVVLLKNESLVPIRDLGRTRIASLTLGGRIETPFQAILAKYTAVQHFVLLNRAGDATRDTLIGQLAAFDLLIVAVHPDGRLAGGEAQYAPAITGLVERLAGLKPLMLVVFDEASVLPQFEAIPGVEALLLGQGHSEAVQRVAAQVIFGGIAAQGALKSGEAPALRGLQSPGGLRFEYTSPEAVGMNAARLTRRLDSLVQAGLDSLAYPGCQLIVVKDRKVIYDKNYGFHTFEGGQPVRDGDLYDLASLTKTGGALPGLMKLHGEGKLNLDLPLSAYLPEWTGTDKAEMTPRQMLAHIARLKATIVFWKETMRKNGKFKWRTLQADSSRRFPVQVYQDLYLHRNYRKKLYASILKTPLNEDPGYVYSDVAFLLFPEIIQRLTGSDYEAYLKENFYHPLGAYTLTYNPTKHFPMARIVPTEFDTVFRYSLVQGYVHDESAAMFGGISGNAGLFGSANDFAKLYQMYMDRGEYGGQSYIPGETLDEFTRYQYPEVNVRRGLGFDKPLLQNPEQGYAAPSASPSSFGHTGFTGTYVWADPAHDLLIVHFTNRVYPYRSQAQLFRQRIRTRLHEALYEEIRAVGKEE